MAAKDAEKVLCSRRHELPREWLGCRSAVALDWDAFNRAMASAATLFRPRMEAENDPRIKQWIPYLLLRRADGRMATYRRNGTEERLHGRLSVGVGGHVNPPDVPASADWRQALYCGLCRELQEEVGGIDPAGVEPECLGVINEEETAVGQVHIGLVCVLDVPHPDRVRPRAEIGRIEWRSPEVLCRAPAVDRLERWSRLALRLAHERDTPPTADIRGLQGRRRTSR